MARRSVPRGLTLLEVLVALTILGFVAAALGGMASQLMLSVRLAGDREAQMLRAEVELAKETLALRAGPEIVEGSRIQGGVRITTLTLAPSLYAVTVADSATGQILLRTSLYKEAGRETSRP
jgi:prepilin-type N-terminal cleavage/methylation domain-containing protein